MSPLLAAVTGLLGGIAIGSVVTWLMLRPRATVAVVAPQTPSPPPGPTVTPPAEPAPADPIAAVPEQVAPVEEDSDSADVRRAIDASENVLAELEKRYVGGRAPSGDDDGTGGGATPRRRTRRTPR